jgi:hypothetical protein
MRNVRCIHTWRTELVLLAFFQRITHLYKGKEEDRNMTCTLMPCSYIQIIFQRKRTRLEVRGPSFVLEIICFNE